MQEAIKIRRRHEREGTYSRYFQGQILDIGHGGCPIHPTALGWDKEEGDAQLLEGIAPESMDVIFSSHCLEHLTNPYTAIQRWWECVRPGGYLIVDVPDSDLYEQGVWPSQFNSDHKWMFTIHKARGDKWAPTVNVTDLIEPLPRHLVHSIRRVDTNYNHLILGVDQTLGAVEAGIEFIVEKLSIA